MLGGYHATCVPLEISRNDFFDFVVAREADWTLCDLIEFVEGNRNKEEIRGIVYNHGEKFVDNFKRFNPDDNPIPFRTKELMQGRKMFDLNYPAPSKQSAALIVGSRGCDYGCKFCLSSDMFPGKKGNRTLFRDIKNIIEEVNLCQEEYGTNSLFFVDLNFYGGDKKRVKELCIELKKTGVGWYGMSRVDVDPEVLEYMANGGCTKIGFGVESLTKPLKGGVTLNAGDWQKLVRERTDLMHDLGVISKGFFILGDYGETKKDIENEASEILNSRFDVIRMSFMLYSPGTPMFNKVSRQNGFTTNDLSLFSTDCPIIKISDASPQELFEIRKEIYRKFYSPARYQEQARNMVAKLPHLKQSYIEFNKILINNLGQGFC